MASPTDPDRSDNSGEITGLVHCSKCATVGYADDRYCPACGAPMLRRCRSCGAAVVHLIAAYCSQCGAGLGADSRRSH